jgi:RNA polymerase sigma-70 factor (ECF subfamily)
MVDGLASMPTPTPTPEPSDGVLAARAARGDDRAFHRLVDRYANDCARYAMHMLDHRQDAEDAVQDTWWRAYRALSRYQERDVFKRWLFRILVNVCRTTIERRGRLRRRFVEDGGALAVAPDVTSDHSHDTTFEHLLMRLNPRAREALLLKFGENLEYTDMAELTGDSVSALKMRVKRALEALRSTVEWEQ